MRSKYFRLTTEDVKYLIEVLDECDQCASEHKYAADRKLSRIIVRMDDYLIKIHREESQ